MAFSKIIVVPNIDNRDEAFSISHWHKPVLKSGELGSPHQYHKSAVAAQTQLFLFNQHRRYVTCLVDLWGFCQQTQYKQSPNCSTVLLLSRTSTYLSYLCTHVPSEDAPCSPWPQSRIWAMVLILIVIRLGSPAWKWHSGWCFLH